MIFSLSNLLLHYGLLLPHIIIIIIITTTTTTIIIISGCPVLVRTLAASHRRFHNLIKTLGRTPLDK
jgi:hypothetical protein